MKKATVVLSWLLTVLAIGGHDALVFAGATDTSYATGASETVKRWARDLWVEMPREIYWGKFFGSSTESIIQEKKDLEGQPGDKLTFTLARKLTGSGVTDDNTLEGNEEGLNTYSDDVTLSQLRNAVRLGGKLSERRTAFSQRDTAKTMLKTWLAETIDDDIFTQFDSAPSTIIYGGNATATTNIGSDDKFTLGLLDKAKAKAAKATPKVWPVRFGNKSYFVVCLHTDVEYDLARDAEWQDIQKEAGPSGEGNNIFTGMLGMYRGHVLHSHEKVPIATTWGSDSLQPGASNFFLGRQAGLFAWGQRPEWWEKEFDYNNKVGFAIGATWDFTKAVFNSVDHAFTAIRTYRSNN